MNLVGTLGKMLLSGALSRGGAGGLGSLLGGATQGGAGGIGDLLGQLGGGQAGAGGAGAGGLGALLGSALGQQNTTAAQKVPEATQQQTDQAALLIRTMINAAKCDGAVDEQEQQKIVGKIGDISAEEAAFIRAEMQKPLDVHAFVQSVPKGLEQQVYALSLMTINLDSKVEADYLDQLAKGFNISEQASNQIHAKLNVPQLYT